MSSITVGALFTKNAGEPATGLTLTDIDLYLYRRAKADGAVETVWNPENAAEEVGGGIYTKGYPSADLVTYEYYGYAYYTGATDLDSDYVLQFTPGFSSAAVWGHGIRTLTQTAASVVAALTGSNIAIRRGDSFTVALTGFGDVSTRAKLWFTVKVLSSDLDTASIVQIEEGAGLVYLNGEDASARSANGSITVDDENAGNFTIVLAGVETVLLTPQDGLVYDLQVLTAAGTITTLTRGRCTVLADVTRATS